jgi:heptosyltransferase-2
MKKVLVMHSWGMGDMIMATPMLKSLFLSEYVVDLVVFSPSNLTVLRDNDFVNAIFLIRSRWQLIKYFNQYDYLVATAGIMPRKVQYLNVFIRAKKVFGSIQERDLHRIDMNLKIVESLLKKRTKEPYIYIDKNKTILRKYLKQNKKNIGFAVGSGSKQKFKRWGKYKELIKNINGNKLLFIGPDEKELEAEYQDLDVTIVKESLEDTVNIIAHLDLLVGNDNGLMHVGYAAKINTVTIYGMTNEKETGGYRENNHAVFLEMPCRPCFDPSTDYVGCQTFDCLLNLQEQKVLSACQKYL